MKGKLFLNSQKYGFTNWFQRLHKKRSLEHWCKENLWVFQDAFEYIKRKNIYSSAQNPAVFWKFESSFAWDLAPRRTQCVNNTRFLLFVHFTLSVFRDWLAEPLWVLTFGIFMGNSFVLSWVIHGNSSSQFRLTLRKSVTHRKLLSRGQQPFQWPRVKRLV